MGRVYRFFIEGREAELGSDFRITLGQNDEILDQLTKVLRVREGDNLVLLDTANQFGDTPDVFSYEVSLAHKKEVGLKFISKERCENELGFELELVLCMPNKPDKLSLILQKAVELGVSAVRIAEGDNSQMKHDLKPVRMARIMKEAAEQSERAFIPTVSFEGKLCSFLGALNESDRESVFIAMERMDEGGVYDFSGEGKCMIVVGPEGGFSDAEKSFVSAQELKTFTLGKRILRMETAAIVALGLASISSPLQ